MLWYEKYLSYYGKSFNEFPLEVIEGIRKQLAVLHSDQPVVSIVIIAYNEERRLPSCLWSLSELKSDYPLEIIGVNNNSNDQTEMVYQSLGITYYNEIKQSPGYARKCGLDHARGKYYFCIDADTVYPPQYVNLMMKKLLKHDVSCVSSFWSFFPDQNHSALGLSCLSLFVMCSYLSSISNVQNYVSVEWYSLLILTMPVMYKSEQTLGEEKMVLWHWI